VRKPGTNPDDVRMSDVLCDFCRSEWTDERPMIEGHHGSCICAACLTCAYEEVVNQKQATAPAGYACTMCLEGESDRESLNRAGEPGWQSPVQPDASVCRRCIKLAAGALERDADFNWSRPRAP